MRVGNGVPGVCGMSHASAWRLVAMALAVKRRSLPLISGSTTVSLAKSVPDPMHCRCAASVAAAATCHNRRNVLSSVTSLSS